MYRVVTFVHDHRRHRHQDNGPWLRTKEEAEYWASLLRKLGYIACIENMVGELPEETMDSDLLNALASMV